MRINTNVASLNAHRQLNMTQGALSESMGRLSSGFRINRAADDAAGLGIANALRANTRALTQASRNAEQANSLLQIAEGATSGVQKMLERMKELAVQSASDTIDDAGGRVRIQSEFEQLRTEISRTISTTKFQDKALLDGTFGAGVKLDAASSTALAGGTNVSNVKLGSGAVAATYTLTVDDGDQTATLTDLATGRAETVTFALGSTDVQALNFKGLGISFEAGPGFNNASADATTIEIEANGATPTGRFLIGSSGDYSGDDMLQVDALNLTTLGLGAISLDTADNALAALTVIDDAIGSVNEVLGKIGAYQNRIENAVANLKTTIQNFSAAESVIRDLDMAEEMTKFSKNQILAQAGTAMLAQANQSSQGVLQLLRG